MDWDAIEYLKEVIQKQSEIAGINFDDINFEDAYWFNSNTWTKDQEDEFKVWVIDRLKNDIKIRRELMAYPSKTKKNLEKWFDSYNLMYGFRIKND